MAIPAIDIEALTPAERLELIERLWDSLGRVVGDVSLSPDQREELDRRLDDLEREGTTSVPWDEAIRKLRAR
jgi:putative addiction module component (TIGR02574 family)